MECLFCADPVPSGTAEDTETLLASKVTCRDVGWQGTTALVSGAFALASRPHHATVPTAAARSGSDPSGLWTSSCRGRRQLGVGPGCGLAPQPRNTRSSSQAIGITRDGQRSSQLWLCRKVASDSHLSRKQADAIVDGVHAAIEDNWDDACERARLTSAQRADLWGREFCNPLVFDTEP
jgi:hypothetical protein